MTGRPKPLIVIIGPTAVGKTRLALEMAEAVNGEIVGADSRQIYRYMDIGTAKPTKAEQRLVPHHLIDVVTPDEQLTLAEYQRLTYAAVDEIHKRDAVPLLVGGTGQYVSAVVEGWSIPEVAPNPELRADLEAFAREHGSEALHARLVVLDPEAAKKIEHQNIRRVVRALEVCIETGQPITELQRKKPPPYETHILGLTMDREALYARADKRVELMMEMGLLEEVHRLLYEFKYDRKLPAMSGIGYAQLAEHLFDGISLEMAVESTKHITHDFIRRQFTWFRKYDHGIMWHNVGDMNVKAIIAQTMDWLEKHP